MKNTYLPTEPRPAPFWDSTMADVIVGWRKNGPRPSVHRTARLIIQDLAHDWVSTQDEDSLDRTPRQLALAFANYLQTKLGDPK